jgi:hypothetical protein
MDFWIRIHWKNADHPFLQLAKDMFRIHVEKDDSIPELSHLKEGGRADYRVRNPAHEVRVSVPFNPAIGGKEALVLEANQTYSVSGATLTEKEATLPGGTKVARHPLLTTVRNSAASTAEAVVYDITVNSEFVDLTEHWKHVTTAQATCKAEPFSCWSAYERLHEPGTELVVLGRTTGNPLIWLAVVPRAARTSAVVSTFVFYRPTFYSYSKLDEPLHGSHGMYAIGRYLLRPRTPDPGVWWAWDRLHKITDAQLATVNTVQNPVSQFYDRLCAGFENAVHRSNKAVVLLYPLPDQLDFGAAAGNLTLLVRNVLALLAARGKVGVGQSEVQAGKLALGGYSAGGPALWQAFQSNKSSLHELYSFDANDAQGQAASLAQWAWETSNFRLRLAGGFAQSMTTHELIARTVRDRLALPGRKASGGQVTVHPGSPTFYNALPAGGGRWWDHAFSEFPGALSSPGWSQFTGDSRHQFVIYGGEDAGFAVPAGGGLPLEGTTFLGQFLRDSTL